MYFSSQKLNSLTHFISSQHPGTNPSNFLSMYDPKTSSSNSHSRRNPSYSSNGEEHEIGFRNRYGEVQFAPIDYQEADDSGAISPPLWSPSRPLLTRRGSFSPDSRAQAIARGRSELMEMVRHMPEASYELSLKDIVEHHHRAENQPAKTEGGALRDEGGSDRRAAAGLKKEESRKFDRKLSFEEKGLFLNMAFPFPFPFRSNKKKKKIAGGHSGRVSPKPEGLKGGGERDWWKRKFTGSSDSDSSRASNNSGGSSSTATTTTSGGRSDAATASERRRNGFTTGCWQFFQLRRSKRA